MRVHLMNLIGMYNIIMTSFNKIKLEYLIQVWEDVMKIENNKKCGKMLMLKKYCGDFTIWTYPPPYVIISHHFRVPLPPSPSGVLFERPLI